MRIKKTFYRTKRQSTRQVFAWATAPYKPETPTSRLHKEQQQQGAPNAQTKRRRWAVGYARAVFGPHFFLGAYTGAENE